MLFLNIWLLSRLLAGLPAWSEDGGSAVAVAGHGAAANSGYAPPPPSNDGSGGYGGGSAGAPGYGRVIQVETKLTEPGSDASGVWRGSREVPSQVEETPPVPSGPAPAMTLSDARMNFPTLVETMVSIRSRSGHWSYPLRGSEPPKKLKLKLHKIEKGSLELVKGAVYSGYAVLRDADSKKLYRMDFTVDYGADLWTVIDHKLNLDEEIEEPVPPVRRPAKRRSPKPNAGSTIP